MCACVWRARGTEGGGINGLHFQLDMLKAFQLVIISDKLVCMYVHGTWYKGRLSSSQQQRF